MLLFYFVDPPSMDPWSKSELGWASFTTLTESETGIVLEPSYTSHKYIKITKGFPYGEYLVLENRQALGYDGIIEEVRCWCGGMTACKHL